MYTHEVEECATEKAVLEEKDIAPNHQMSIFHSEGALRKIGVEKVLLKQQNSRADQRINSTPLQLVTQYDGLHNRLIYVTTDLLRQS